MVYSFKICDYISFKIIITILKFRINSRQAYFLYFYGNYQLIFCLAFFICFICIFSNLINLIIWRFSRADLINVNYLHIARCCFSPPYFKSNKSISQNDNRQKEIHCLKLKSEYHEKELTVQISTIRYRKINLKFIKIYRSSAKPWSKLMKCTDSFVIPPSSLSIFDIYVGKIFIEKRFEWSIALDSIERCFRLASLGGKDQGAVRPCGAEADERDERQHIWSGYR